MSLGRKIIVNFEGEDVVNSDNPAKVETVNSGQRAVTLGGVDDLQLALLEVNGWLEVNQEDARSVVTCNGHLQHLLVLRLPSLHDGQPLALQADLNSGPATSASPVLLIGMLMVEGDNGSVYTRPKRPIPPSLFSNDSAGVQRSVSLSHNIGDRSGEF